MFTSSKFGVGGGNLSYSELMFTSSKFGVGSEKFHQKWVYVYHASGAGLCNAPFAHWHLHYVQVVLASSASKLR